MKSDNTRDLILVAQSIVDLVKLSHEIASAKGFTEATPGEDIALIHSEASEALEDIRSGRPLTETRYAFKETVTLTSGVQLEVERVEEHPTEDFGLIPGKPVGVPSEMADILIRVFHFCGKHKIDLQTAIKEKLTYNATRSHKHGGKTL